MRLPTPNDRQRTLAGRATGRTTGRATGRTGADQDTGPMAGLESGLNVASYPIGGVAAYGLIGWLIGRVIHASWPLPAGMIFGLVLGTAYLIYRYGTKTGAERAEAAIAKAKAKTEAKAQAKAEAKAEAKKEQSSITTPRRETYR
jgi:hypothetical protein